MRVLAIDPGYERLGVGIIEKDQTKNKKEFVVFSECFRTPQKDSFEDRLLAIGMEVEMLITKFKPEALVIENLFLSNNQKTAMRVAEVRGAILYICKKFNLKIMELTPLQIKMAVTGNGRSSKPQVIKMVQMLVLNPKMDVLDDEYDAIAAGLAYFSLSKNNIKPYK